MAKLNIKYLYSYSEKELNKIVLGWVKQIRKQVRIKFYNH